MFQFPRFAFVPYGFGKQIPSFDICKSEPWGATCVGKIAQNSELQISKVGFPIRKSTDQSLFAAPHDLSQRTTSFIASQRQGIHRIPLRHLIALIINAHRSAAKGLRSVLEGKPKGSIIKDQFASNTSESVAVMRRPRLKCLPGEKNAGAIGCISSSRCQITRFPCSKDDPCARKRNLVLGRCHGTAKACKRAKAWGPPSGGARRDRTDDLMLAKHALSQLSYGPVAGGKPKSQIRECARLSPAHWRARWWAWEDLNFRPHAYQARALTN